MTTRVMIPEPHLYRRFAPLLRFLGKLQDFILFPTIFFRKTTLVSADTVKKILIMEGFLIGDLVMTAQLASALKRLFPTARIDLLANPFAQHVLSQKYFGRVETATIPFSSYNYSFTNLRNFFACLWRLRKERYDIALETRGDWRQHFCLWMMGAQRRVGLAITGHCWLTDPVPSAKNCSLADARRLLVARLGGAIQTQDKVCFKHLDQSARRVEEFLRGVSLQDKPFVVFHPGASIAKRRLPGETFGALADYLKQQQVHFVAVLPPGMRRADLGVDENVPLFQGELADLFELFKRCDRFLAMDSGPAHMASAFQKRGAILCFHDQPGLVSPMFFDGVISSAQASAPLSWHAFRSGRMASAPVFDKFEETLIHFFSAAEYAPAGAL